MSKVKPTIEDVARAAGVSRATASRVINNAPGASSLLRARVHEAVTELGYQPNEAARALASGRLRAVDVIAVTYGPGIGWLGTHPYFSRVLAGMMPILEGAHAQLRLHAVGLEAAGDAIDEIAANATVGAVLADITPDLAARFHRQSGRVVSMVPTAASVPAMQADNVGGAYAAIQELHRLGRRRIAAIHGPAFNPCAIDRRIGYQRAVHNIGTTASQRRRRLPSRRRSPRGTAAPPTRPGHRRDVHSLRPDGRRSRPGHHRHRPTRA